MKAGRLSEAATNIRRAIERKPDAFGYHFALGSVLKKSGDLQGALEQFKAELVNNPRQTAAVQQIADIEARLNNGGNEQVKNLAPASPSR
jgi:predicted Zn-dependent protease